MTLNPWRNSILAALLVCAPGLAAADYYSYTTEEGTFAFTDDLKRVPARYRDAANKHSDRRLVDYSRLTIVPRGATTAAGLDWPGPDLSDVAAAPGLADPAMIRLQLGGSVSIEVPAGSGSPIIVKRRRYRYSNGYLKPHTIVEQDGRILADIEDN